MHQSYVPFSKLDVDAVFKILDKEKTIGQYGEKLVLYLEPSPNNQDFISDVVIKTNAPKSLKEKISEDSEIDEFIVSKGKINGKKTIKTLYLKSDSISFQTGFPYVADFDIMEDDLVLAKKIDKTLKVGHTKQAKNIDEELKVCYTKQKRVKRFKLPSTIKIKNAVINVKNTGKRSFEYAILSALHHNKIKNGHDNPLQYKEYLDNLNFTGIEFPVSLKDIDRFEKQNPEIKVDVIVYNRNLQIARKNETDSQTVINLLLFIKNENRHYCWIKNVARLFFCPVSKTNCRNKRGRYVGCDEFYFNTQFNESGFA